MFHLSSWQFPWWLYFGRLLKLLLVLAVTYVFSHWYWRLAEPPFQALEIHSLESDPRHLAAQLIATNLFGKRDGSTGAVTPHLLEEEFKLVGVAAGGGVALIAIGSRSAEAFRVGADFSPGTRLLKVAPHHIEFERAGLRHKLNMADEKWKK